MTNAATFVRAGMPTIGKTMCETESLSSYLFRAFPFPHFPPFPTFPFAIPSPPVFFLSQNPGGLEERCCVLLHWGPGRNPVRLRTFVCFKPSAW